MLLQRVTALIGRFSIFHLGHSEVLLRALKKSEVVVLLIGSSFKARNTKDPFTYQERADIINSWYREQERIQSRYHQGTKLGKLITVGVADYPYNTQQWIMEVQNKVSAVRKEHNIPADWPNFLTGADRDASTWYLKVFGSFFQTDFVPFTEAGFELNATTLRTDYFEGGNLWEYKTPAETIYFLDKFKAGDTYKALVDEHYFLKKYKASWASAPFPPTFVTVDTCVIQSGHVLVVTRAAQPGKGLWALPGGFVEQDERLEDAAIRELVEETSIELSKAQLYGSIIGFDVYDDPSRSLRGRTISTCYTLKLNDGFKLPKTKAQPGEVSKLRWLPLAEALNNPDKWFEDHYSMVSKGIARVSK